MALQCGEITRLSQMVSVSVVLSRVVNVERQTTSEHIPGRPDTQKRTHGWDLHHEPTLIPGPFVISEVLLIP